MLELKPYMIKGVPQFPDALVLGLWEKTKASKKAEFAIYDLKELAATDFLEKINTTWMLFILFMDDKPVAYIWLNNIRPRCADMHFCTVEDLGTNLQEAGRFTLNYLLGMKYDGDFFIDTLIASVPAHNKKAISYIKSLGMKERGVIPFGAYVYTEGKSIDMVVHSINRDGV